MAYTLARREDEQGTNANVERGAAAGQVAPGQPVAKNTGVTGGGTGAPSATGGPGQNPASFTQSKSQGGAAQAIFDRNKGAQPNAGIYNTLLAPGQQKAANATSAVQKEQSDYLTGAQSFYKPPDANDQDISQVGRDPNATQKVSAALNYKPGDYQDYSSTVDSRVMQPQQLATGNIQSQLIKSKAGSGRAYGRGMGALDATLFANSGGQGQLQKAYGDLQQGVNSEVAKGAGIEADLAKQSGINAAAIQERLKAGIGNAKSGILSGAESRAAQAFQTGRQAQLAQGKTLGTEREKALFESPQVKEYLARIDSMANSTPQKQQLKQDFVNKLLGIDEGGFTKTPEAQAQANQFYNAGDVDALNALSGLVGEQGNYTAGNPYATSVDFDQAAYDQAAKGIMDSFSPQVAQQEKTDRAITQANNWQAPPSINSVGGERAAPQQEPLVELSKKPTALEKKQASVKNTSIISGKNKQKPQTAIEQNRSMRF